MLAFDMLMKLFKIVTSCNLSLLSKGVRCKPQQDSACAGHPAEEPDQAGGVPEQLSDRQIRGRAVLRREELSDQADPGPEETHGARGGLRRRGRLLYQVFDV